ncbi:MAG: SpoIIIAH-like family protein [Sporomusaceae bacterium]|nr:SpoIIIAH-like family protein [Sporomusaceae bacterium]
MVMTIGRKKTFLVFVCFVMLGAAFWGVKVYREDSSKQAEMQLNALPVSQNHSEALQIAASPDFFVEYRLEREKVRSEKAEVLREIIRNSPTEEARSHAQDSVLRLMQDKQKELEMENLIKSKGFYDALVFIREESVSAVVKSASLSRDDVLQIADIIHRVANVKAEEITISAKP